MLSRIRSHTSSLAIGDLYNPQTFDALKDNIDQNAFYALYENHSTDPIVQCRKAELLIQLESDDEALALLEGNASLLAQGLKAKIFAAQNKFEEVEKLCEVDYKGSDPIMLEGQMHLLNMSMHASYMRHDYEAALIKCEQAESIAKTLGLSGRLKALAAEREVIQTKLGISSKEILQISGNLAINQFQLITRWRTLMVTGQFDQAAQLEVEPALMKLALATRYFQGGSIYRAATTMLDTVPSRDEFRLYHALLTLQIFVKTQDVLYADPGKALKTLQSIMIIPQMLEEARYIYPLGICLAASQMPIFKGASQLIPRLKHARYRDGVWIDGKLVAVIPNEIREAMIYDSLNPGENFLQSVRRQYRHRAASSLAKAHLEHRHIVTQAEIARDISRLNEFLCDKN